MWPAFCALAYSKGQSINHSAALAETHGHWKPLQNLTNKWLFLCEWPVGGTVVPVFLSPVKPSSCNPDCRLIAANVIVSFKQESKHWSGSAVQENPSSLNTDTEAHFFFFTCFSLLHRFHPITLFHSKSDAVIKCVEMSRDAFMEACFHRGCEVT